MRTKAQAQASTAPPPKVDTTGQATLNRSDTDDMLRNMQSPKPAEAPPEEKPKETPDTKKLEAMTPEEMDLNKKRFKFAMGFSTENPDEEKKVEEPPKEEPKAEEPKKEEPKKEEPKKEEPKKEEPPKEEKTEEKPKPKKKRLPLPEEPKVDVEEVATRAAEKVLSKVAPPPPEPTKEDPEASLPPSYKRDLSIVRRMEKDSPEHHGLSDQLLKWYGKENDYIAQWQKDNPGVEFNAKAPEHENFYGTMPVIDETAFEVAKENILLEQAEARALARVQEQEKQRQQQEIVSGKDQSIMAEVGQAVGRMLEEADPELTAAMQKDGKLELTDEASKRLLEQNEPAWQILDNEAEKLGHCVSELEKYQKLGESYKPNANQPVRLRSGEVFLPTDYLVGVASEMEANMAQMPVEQSTWNGKRWMPQAKFIARQEAIMKDPSLPQFQKESALRDLYGKYWFMDTTYIKRQLPQHFAETAGEKYSKLKALAMKLAGLKNGSSGEAPPSPSKAKAASTTENTGPANPPSTTTESDRLNTTGKTKINSGLTAEDVVNSMWG